MSYIAIVDYGAGNLMSVHNTLDYLGYENKIAASADVIENAAGVILPGVGAFPDAMAALEHSGLTEAVLKAAKEKPFLGICLGMQIAAIAFARGVLGYEDANSTEFAPDSKHPVWVCCRDALSALKRRSSCRRSAGMRWTFCVRTP